jgi:hypothetical protein
MRTGRPSSPERNLDKNQRIGGFHIDGKAFDKLTADAQRRGTSIGNECARLINRALAFEQAFSGETLDSVHVVATGLQFAETTKDPTVIDQTIVAVARRLVLKRAKLAPLTDRMLDEIANKITGAILSIDVEEANR